MCGCSDFLAKKTHIHANLVDRLEFARVTGELASSIEALSSLVDALLSGVVPVGSISLWGSFSIPDGWLLCDGQEYTGGPEPGGYAALFGVIGTTFNTGGESGFRVPDLRGVSPLGWKNGTTFNALGLSGGEEDHLLVISESPQHNHPYRAADNVYRQDIAYGTTPGSGTGFVRNLGGATTLTQFIGNSGGNEAHNNMHPYLVVNFIIKAG